MKLFFVFFLSASAAFAVQENRGHEIPRKLLVACQSDGTLDVHVFRNALQRVFAKVSFQKKEGSWQTSEIDVKEARVSGAQAQRVFTAQGFSLAIDLKDPQGPEGFQSRLVWKEAGIGQEVICTSLAR